ncbi:nuclear transport factor 2 family protein [Salinibacillus xinjiangensis]|uniref:DUF4440 domain-containing protein n=1 Tax=Salinibacillus xinjiangensis TaxID=1229268 RepID=A0A6G1X449_9BACI|nr:DUF4440 domain-containing protein [Salinibacillus xinjiangensis]MRG85685.1 DUF4440 domain-containing protein [Salinibacillus xinjiangensis]
MVASNLSSHIEALEKKLLQPEVRKSTEELTQLLSNDFTEFGSSGRIFTKQDILDRLPAETSVEMELTNLNLKKLASDVVLVTYTVTINHQKHSLRSSIWKKNSEGYWQMYFHQGTKTP